MPCPYGSIPAMIRIEITPNMILSTIHLQLFLDTRLPRMSTLQLNRNRFIRAIEELWMPPLTNQTRRFPPPSSPARVCRSNKGELYLTIIRKPTNLVPPSSQCVALHKRTTWLAWSPSNMGCRSAISTMNSVALLPKRNQNGGLQRKTCEYNGSGKETDENRF